MNKEEKQAIDILQNCIADYVIGDYCVGKYCPQEDACKNDDCPFEKAIYIVLNLIEKQNKVIDKMAYYIAGREIIHTNKEVLIIQELWSKVTPEKPIWDLIKEYFYKEIENEKI